MNGQSHGGDNRQQQLTNAIKIVIFALPATASYNIQDSYVSNSIEIKSVGLLQS